MADSRPHDEQNESIVFTLPGGYLTSDGNCYKDVELRPLTGKEEELIADRENSKMVASLLVDILANCTKRIGPMTEISPDVIRNMVIADRDYLLLCLRQLTFGENVEARVRCPNEKCKKLMDISFDITGIKIIDKDLGNGFFLTELSDTAAYRDRENKLHKEIEFRLPTAGDQEEAAKIYPKNQSKALTTLFSRCLVRVGDITEIDENIISSLTILARREIESSMKAQMPVVHLGIEVTCPQCNMQFESPFDIQNFFLKN